MSFQHKGLGLAPSIEDHCGIYASFIKNKNNTIFFLSRAEPTCDECSRFVSAVGHSYATEDAVMKIMEVLEGEASVIICFLIQG